MNKVVLMGRLTKTPEFWNGTGKVAVVKFVLAVNRKIKKDGEPSADFINCIAFGKLAEIINEYCMKGLKIIVSGRIQTGSYTNRDGKQIYTTEVVVEELDFCEKKSDDSKDKEKNEFLQIDQGEIDQLPFK